MLNIQNSHTICALATPAGAGAIGVIRLSGNKAMIICDKVFYNERKKQISKQKTHTIHFGAIKDGKKIIDEVLVSVFKNPNSYTGEDLIEVSCHGSAYIQQQIIQLFIRNGACMAKPGEFTLRAFLNGKLDLSQAEAVADLIASDSEASHKIAMRQMRGGFSSAIKILRQELVNFASLIELELDFSEENVEFADRKQMSDLIEKIQKTIRQLSDSFSFGNVIKNGVPVVITGKPNVGKSTLLNVLLNEDRSIVSEIAGTTRDAIEDEITIRGVNFRFVDTAGIRESADSIEQLGISKTFEKLKGSAVVLYLFDVHEMTGGELQNIIEHLKKVINEKNTKILLVGNKIDKEDDLEIIRKEFNGFGNVIYISARENKHINELTDRLLDIVNVEITESDNPVVSNARHYDALLKTDEALTKVKKGIQEKTTGDLLAEDVRSALEQLGYITGEITNDDILGNIFSKFCIGK